MSELPRYYVPMPDPDDKPPTIFGVIMFLVSAFLVFVFLGGIIWGAVTSSW